MLPEEILSRSSKTGIIISVLVVLVFILAAIYGSICSPTPRVNLYPLTQETFTDPSLVFQITISKTPGENVHRIFSPTKDRFLETDGDAYYEDWINHNGRACYTVYASPAGQKNVYLWMSAIAENLATTNQP